MNTLYRLCAALIVSMTATVFAAEGDDAVATVKAFQEALHKRDEATATRLLATDVLIYESGGQESSRGEYASHHIKGDMAFLAAAHVERIDQRVVAQGDVAVVATRSRIHGTHKGKTVDIISTETMALKRAAGGWQITHIHWSSRPRDPKSH